MSTHASESVTFHSKLPSPVIQLILQWKVSNLLVHGYFDSNDPPVHHSLPCYNLKLHRTSLHWSLFFSFLSLTHPEVCRDTERRTLDLLSYSNEKKSLAPLECLGPLCRVYPRHTQNYTSQCPSVQCSNNTTDTQCIAFTLYNSIRV